MRAEMRMPPQNTIRGNTVFVDSTMASVGVSRIFHLALSTLISSSNVGMRLLGRRGPRW